MRSRFATASIAMLAGAVALSGAALAHKDHHDHDHKHKHKHGHHNVKKTLELDAIGSLTAGGRKVCAPGPFDPTVAGAGSRNQGQCFQIDQIYAQYLKPKGSKKLPIVFIHGGAGTGKAWETTPDGREGFAVEFARRGHPTYVVDFPRRGRAGIPTFTGALGDLDGQQIGAATSFAVGDKQAYYSWRLGTTSYPNLDPNSKFPAGVMDDFLQGNVPLFGDNNDVIADSIVALLEKIGPAILVTHSQSGIHGWMARYKSDNVKGIITFEGGYVFPENNVPPPMKNCAGANVTQGTATTVANFKRLSQVPILVMYGDNSVTCPMPNLIRDGHQLNPEKGRSFVNALNANGGKAQFIWTKERGIPGNTHFLFLDTNSLQIADFVSSFLKKYNLDKDQK
jgi:pimeloyl-ACP methyl ester carboxylesterase